MRTRPLVIAHGGNSCEAPQNSLTAFEQAVEIGVDAIELDVNRTRDGYPVIFHGPNLKKTTGVEGSIHDLTLKQARQLDVGSWKDAAFASERMLTLQEVLDFARGKVRLAVDLKTVDILPTIVQCIRDAGMVDDVVICGCSAIWAQKVRACDPRLSVGLNMDSAMVALAKQSPPSVFHQAYIREATSHYLSPLNISFKYVTGELVRVAHLRATQLWGWTVDDPEKMRELVEMGVDAIYTNFPQTLLEVVG
jgi:glycerophosphoryl diester phosphodiesterase